MFEDIKDLVKNSNIPEIIKIIIIVIIRCITWFVWAFIGIGILIKNEFFIYLLLFFIFIEAFLVIALITVLISSIKYFLNIPNNEPDKYEKTEIRKSTLVDKIRDGIIGNSAFYVFLIIVFIIVKIIGGFDGINHFINTFINAPK